MRPLSRLAAVASLTVLAAACGSSNDSSSPGSGTTAPAATSAAPTTSSGGGGGGEAEIEIEGFQYTVPASVPSGATIKVVNKDSTAHTVTSGKDKSQFDSDVEGNGTSTFTAPGTPGTYAIVCTLHPNMHGTLVVK
jgi:plastocyanin